MGCVIYGKRLSTSLRRKLVPHFGPCQTFPSLTYTTKVRLVVPPYVMCAREHFSADPLSALAGPCCSRSSYTHRTCSVLGNMLHTHTHTPSHSVLPLSYITLAPARRAYAPQPNINAEDGSDVGQYKVRDTPDAQPVHCIAPYSSPSLLVHSIYDRQ